MNNQLSDRKLRILEASERSGEASKIGRGGQRDIEPPDPEVPAKAARRRFSAAYKLKILKETDKAPGQVGAILRREGLYYSHLGTWRGQRRKGTLQGLAPKKRGRKSRPKNPLDPEVKRLNRENAALKRKLEQAALMLEIQKKASQMLGISLRETAQEDES